MRSFADIASMSCCRTFASWMLLYTLFHRLSWFRWPEGLA